MYGHSLLLSHILTQLQYLFPPRLRSPRFLPSSSRNIHMAGTRAWDQTVLSRGKGPDFWGPYVEEWDPQTLVDECRRGVIVKAFETSIGRFLIKNVSTFT